MQTTSERDFNRAVRAVFHREGIALRRRWRGNAVMWFCLLLLIVVSAIARLRGVSTATEAPWLAQLAYGSVLVSAIVTLSTLRFWQEKSGRTIDTLLALPLSLRSTFLAKVIFPATIGVGVGVAAGLVMIVAFSVAMGAPVPGTLGLLAVLVGMAVTNICLGVLNGYAMWAMSESAAKLAQMATMILVIGAFASLAVIDPATFGATAAVVCASVVSILLLVSVLLIARLDAEKIILQQGE